MTLVIKASFMLKQLKTQMEEDIISYFSQKLIYFSDESKIN